MSEVPQLTSSLKGKFYQYLRAKRMLDATGTDLIRQAKLFIVQYNAIVVEAASGYTNVRALFQASDALTLYSWVEERAQYIPVTHVTTIDRIMFSLPVLTPEGESITWFDNIYLYQAMITDMYASRQENLSFDLDYFSLHLNIAHNYHDFAQRAIEYFPQQQNVMQQYVDMIALKEEEVFTQSARAAEMRFPRFARFLTLYEISFSATHDLSIAFDELLKLIPDKENIPPRVNQIN